MQGKEHWEDRYKKNNSPWDTGKPAPHLIDVVENLSFKPGSSALDVGCGTGTNAIWLAEHGYTVTGIDISEQAINAAKENSEKKGVSVDFYAADFLKEGLPGGPFSFVFDRGCFHSFETDDERSSFAEEVNNVIQPKGVWLSIIGSCDSPPRDIGPPMRTAKNIVDAVEFNFEIIELSAIFFDSNHSKPPRAWKCLMKKRAHHY